ncbi:hypothetical protein E2C01_071590 [Portunus trituberculatus]|uniref:Uncharacterized protein n=1 Tax=Portunus trituberculatus TaxID=210409 RepID=A0A5B7I4B5_PORTR|nr:hypothetical protein [Portunus trituberculatus]
MLSTLVKQVEPSTSQQPRLPHTPHHHHPPDLSLPRHTASRPPPPRSPLLLHNTPQVTARAHHSLTPAGHARTHTLPRDQPDMSTKSPEHSEMRLLPLARGLLYSFPISTVKLKACRVVSVIWWVKRKENAAAPNLISGGRPPTAEGMTPTHHLIITAKSTPQHGSTVRHAHKNTSHTPRTPEAHPRAPLGRQKPRGSQNDGPPHTDPPHFPG